jgi:hypothetical protein
MDELTKRERELISRALEYYSGRAEEEELEYWDEEFNSLYKKGL